MDKTADVVVVGYGLAGAVAAITARDAGAEVIILEKQPRNKHWSNSSSSGGVILCPSDVNGSIEYLNGLYRVSEDLSWTDHDIIRVWSEYASDGKAWLEKMGGKLGFVGRGGIHPQIPGSESMEIYQFKGMGHRMMQFFYQQVSQRGVEVMYGTRARRLITDSNGRVVGVIVQTGQTTKENVREINIGASRAIILTCGGFEFNERMKLQYLGLYPVNFMGTPANIGDGINMALGVGSDLWHMNCMVAPPGAKFANYPYAFPLDFGGPKWRMRSLLPADRSEPNGFVIVDKYGRRFTNENLKIHYFSYELMLFDTQKLDYPRVPSYFIFDRKRMEAGRLASVHAGPCGPLQLYKWSRDNSAELEKGWIIGADNVRELAKKLDVSPHVLEGTVQTYNGYARTGKDLEFNRRATDLAPLVNPPFYAVRLWPVGANTQGGPRRNRKGQILNTDGDPIPGLYSAGELGSIFGKLYPQSGGNLAECIAFGRIAGEYAAREKAK